MKDSPTISTLGFDVAVKLIDQQLQALHTTTYTNTCEGCVTIFVPSIDITAVLCDQMCHQGGVAYAACIMKDSPTFSTLGTDTAVKLIDQQLQALHTTTITNTCKGCVTIFVFSIEITAALCDQMSHQGGAAIATCIMKDSSTKTTLGFDVAVKLIDQQLQALHTTTYTNTCEGCVTIFVPSIDITAVLCDQMSHQGGVAYATCIMKDSPTFSTLGFDVAVKLIDQQLQALHTTTITNTCKGCVTIFVFSIEITAALCDQMSHQGGAAIATCIMKDSSTKTTLGFDVAVKLIDQQLQALHTTTHTNTCKGCVTIRVPSIEITAVLCD